MFTHPVSFRYGPWAILPLLLGCFGEALAPRRLDTLQAARAVWEAAGIVDYIYRVDRRCFCGFFGLAEIEVRDGTVVGVTQVETGSAIEPQFYQFYDTVEDLFDLIEQAIGRQAETLSVQYDEDLGYPVLIELDYRADTDDDELTVVVSGLTESP